MNKPQNNISISNCCICGNKTNIIYKIKFKYLIGLYDDYEESVGFCDRCGFLFNANPFSDEQLAKRYKDMSKYQIDENIDKESSSYIKRCKSQYNFITNEINDIVVY